MDSIYWVAVIKGADENFEERERELLDLNEMSIAIKKVIKATWHDEIETSLLCLGRKQIKETSG